MEKNNPLSQIHRNIDRRSFLKLSGLLGLGLASTGIIPQTAKAVKFNRNTYKVSKTRLAMGTYVSMTLIHPSRDKAERAIGLAFEEIDRLTGLMNRFDDSTAVARLNRSGFLNDTPPEVSEVIARALAHYRLSHGAFDISVKPVVDLFREKFTAGKKMLPKESELKQVLKLVGSDKIELRGWRLRLKKQGMGITLDGIAKGYIVDKASKALAGQKINNHLINAGGDIRAMGSRSENKPWTVAIQDPLKRKIYPDIIHMTDGAIATSGNYEVYFDQEKMFHHIVDPRTGLSSGLNDASVSVLAKTAMDADAFSTSVFVMDPIHGIRFINSVPGCECLVITKANKKIKSEGWKGTVI